MGEGCADGNEDNVIEFQAALLLRLLVEKIHQMFRGSSFKNNKLLHEDSFRNIAKTTSMQIQINIVLPKINWSERREKDVETFYEFRSNVT